jgi:hypothetical protein
MFEYLVTERYVLFTFPLFLTYNFNIPLISGLIFGSGYFLSLSLRASIFSKSPDMIPSGIVCVVVWLLIALKTHFGIFIDYLHPKWGNRTLRFPLFTIGIVKTLCKHTDSILNYWSLVSKFLQICCWLCGFYNGHIV